MSLVESRQASSTSPDPVKMEDRKRPASAEQEDAHAPKRQAIALVNGHAKAAQDSDMPGGDELEKFQKEAILRQMNEYKREARRYEAEAGELNAKAVHHDEHLRLVDAWFDQKLLSELQISFGKVPAKLHYIPFPSALLNDDTKLVESHFAKKAEMITAAITEMLSSGTVPVSPDATQLQAQVASLLATQKAHINELERMKLEHEQLNERLEEAALRYMMAEKRLDRARSITVAKLERQATAAGRTDNQSNGAETQRKSPATVVDDAQIRKLEVEKEGLSASLATRQEQLEASIAEKTKSDEQIAILQTRLATLSDDDYAHTDLFKNLRLRHEDVLKRVDELQATNKELQQEAQKLQSERNSHRGVIESESSALVAEKDGLVRRLETDLTRIRTTRDELQAEMAIRKAKDDQSRAAATMANETLQAKDDRIKVLESELARLELSKADQPDPADESLSPAELVQKIGVVKQQAAMLGQEVSSMGAAYKKMSTLASQKLHSLKEMEDKTNRLTGEKARADQKYFGAMKAKDACEQEIRALKATLSKSSNIVTQLKEAEASARAVISNLEKQVTESKSAFSTLASQSQRNKSQLDQAQALESNYRRQAEELKNLLSQRETSQATSEKRRMDAEAQVASLKVELSEAEARLASRPKFSGSDSEHVEMLRALAICTVCRKDFKDTVLKTCGHVFCKNCVDERVSNRMRKCPNCNKAFGGGDYMKITL